jgi:hypothetical protein
VADNQRAGARHIHFTRVLNGVVANWFRGHIAAEIDKWARVVKEAGIKPE